MSKNAEKKQKTLKEWRKENRYTMKEVAEATGIPYGTMVALDCNYRKPSLMNAQKIAKFYGISVDEIKVVEPKKGE